MRTPGPWKIGHSYTSEIAIRNNDEDCVAVVCELLEGEMKDNAAFIIEAVNNYDRLMAENKRLKEALKGLTENICLRNLNVRKDFSLINAHAFACKVLHVEEVTP